MNKKLIDNVITDFAKMVQECVGKDVIQCRLFGSFARGDYDDDSDIDIILLANCDRKESEKYTNVLIDIVTELAMKYFVVVNTVCVPHREYEEKKKWYDLFANIEAEGCIIYG